MMTADRIPNPKHTFTQKSRAASPLLSKLIDLNAQTRANSICWHCGKSRLGIRMPRCGGQVTQGYDSTGSEAENATMALPESYAASGLCVCERVEFYCNGQQVINHPAADGVLMDFTPACGDLMDVTVLTKTGMIVVNAASFEGEVYGRIVAPDQDQDGIRFGFSPVPNVDDAEAAIELRFAQG